MKRFNLELLILFLILFVVDCQKWNSNGNGKNGKKTARVGSYFLEETNGGKSTEVNPIPAKSQAMKPMPKGGIGAWGYVSIILFVILSGMGVYYTIIFYPIVCKKQRMYHVMGSTTV